MKMHAYQKLASLARTFTTRQGGDCAGFFEALELSDFNQKICAGMDAANNYCAVYAACQGFCF